MWLAGAYEGFATSILWCLELRIPLEEVVGRDLRNLLQNGMSTPTAVIKLVEERSTEALAMYGRNIAFAGLEVECSLKVARMYEDAFSAGLSDREQKVWFSLVFLTMELCLHLQTGDGVSAARCGCSWVE